MQTNFTPTAADLSNLVFVVELLVFVAFALYGAVKAIEALEDAMARRRAEKALRQVVDIDTWTKTRRQELNAAIAVTESK